MKKKYLFFIYFIFILFILFIFNFSNFSYAAYPKLVARLINGFEQIKTWIIRISTPAAAVAVRNRRVHEKV